MAKILICDDAVFMRKMIRDTLEKAGHQVVAEAEDAGEAERAYLAHRPELVTMDLLMRRSGVEGVQRLKKINPQVKIVIVSVLDAQQAEVVDAIRAEPKAL